MSTIRKDGTKSASKGDFAMKLTALVEAGSHTGYLALALALVKRRIDLVEKYVQYFKVLGLVHELIMSDVHVLYNGTCGCCCVGIFYCMRVILF